VELLRVCFSQTIRPTSCWFQITVSALYIEKFVFLSNKFLKKTTYNCMLINIITPLPVIGGAHKTLMLQKMASRNFHAVEILIIQNVLFSSEILAV
jgi:hypothetical protein